MDKITFVDSFAEQFDETPREAISFEGKIKDLEEWSSLIALATVAMINEKYGVKLTGDEVEQADTVQDLYNLVEKKKNG